MCPWNAKMYFVTWFVYIRYYTEQNVYGSVYGLSQYFALQLYVNECRGGWKHKMCQLIDKRKESTGLHHSSVPGWMTNRWKTPFLTVFSWFCSTTSWILYTYLSLKRIYSNWMFANAFNIIAAQIPQNILYPKCYLFS